MNNQELDILIVGLKELAGPMEPLFWFVGSAFLFIGIVFWWAVYSRDYLYDIEIKTT